MTVKCPYCNKENRINYDDGYGLEEGELLEMECKFCEKNFVFDTFILFNHHSHKADCLNGGKHDFKKTHAYPPEFVRMRCTMCGQEKRIPAVDTKNV